MVSDAVASDLRDAMDGLSRDGWAGLPALARLNARGARVVIDMEASAHVGTPVVILREDLVRPEGLTPRQGEVALAVARGLSNAEIAAELGVSVATIKDHVHAILQRLGARRRGEISAACHGRKSMQDARKR